MFKITSKIDAAPYQKFYEFYERAIEQDQVTPEAMAVSSLDDLTKEIDSRIVNLKYVTDDQWIFFSNYNSPKALQFNSHNQISVLFYWPSINSQSRVKALIKKIEARESDLHFASRSIEKNTLAIISNQSNEISSYDLIVKKFTKTLNSQNDSQHRPDYWGGYSFEPFYFEFWEGQKFRLNLRESFYLNNSQWMQKILQP